MDSQDKRIDIDLHDYVSKRIAKSPSILRNITPTCARQSNENPQVEFQNYLVSTAKGGFLFLKLTLDLIERGHLVIKSSSFKILPKSLSEVFLLEFNLKFPTVQNFRKVSDILSVCLASLQPLTLPDIYNTVSALYVSPSFTWSEFLLLFKTLTGYLVVRRDDSVMFFHPLFREWLIRRGESDPSKFMCDPRTGHAALALRMSRMESPIDKEQIVELSHHILKAHLYRNITMPIPSRDLLSSWISLSSEDMSVALGFYHNIFSPNINVSRLLLLSGASPDVITNFLQSAPIICVFAQRGYTEMISLLLEFGADINSVNSEGYSPLIFAAKEGRLECVRTLVEKGAKVNQVDKAQCCSLVHAVKNTGHFPVVEFLVSCDWIADEGQDLELAEAAQQAVVVAAYEGHVDILEFLLDMSEVNIDSADTLMAETPLCAAAAAGKKDCCEILLRRGASSIATNLKQLSPLQIAATEGHYAICDILIREGANIEQEDTLGRSALIDAAIAGHHGVLELLVAKEAKVRKTDNENLTALLWACAKGKIESAKFLLSHGADINHKDSKGRTALDLAASSGDAYLVQYLLEQGAVMENVDISGMRPLDRAISCGNSDVVKCFLKKGAKLGPSTWAMASGKPYIM